MRYGSGTKVLHNISGLVGVMDGAGSDLRTGLPFQMVWVHEPMRLTFVMDVLSRHHQPHPATASRASETLRQSVVAPDCVGHPDRTVCSLQAAGTMVVGFNGVGCYHLLVDIMCARTGDTSLKGLPQPLYISP